MISGKHLYNHLNIRIKIEETQMTIYKKIIKFNQINLLKIINFAPHQILIIQKNI
jgi:hypothetical protein